MWFMDDGVIGRKFSELLQDFALVKREGFRLDLHVNERKCELITDDADVRGKFREVAPHLAHVMPSKSCVSIGSAESMDDILSVKLEELKCFAKRLENLNAHDALYLLRQCLISIPKLTYRPTVRCAPCFTSALLQAYDDITRSS